MSGRLIFGQERAWARWLRVPAAVLACASCVTAGGCAADWYARDADEEVLGLLADVETRTLGDREATVRRPRLRTPAGGTEASLPGRADPDAHAAEAAGARPPDGAPAEPPVAMELGLAESLAIAFTTSRQFKDQQEALYLQGLGYALSRYLFGPILDATIAYLWSGSEDADASDSLGVSTSATDILPTGGVLTVSGALAALRADDPPPFDVAGDPTLDSALAVNLRQPLLRGAGYEASHDALTQAEHDLVYAVRDFELFRQEFAITVASSFFAIVSRGKRLVNDELAYENAVFDRQKAEALRQLDRMQDEDVIIARRREAEQETALLGSRTDYDAVVDDFKILLGLPSAVELTMRDEEPPFEQVLVETESAVEVALANRIDLHTERDRLDDFERRVRVARDALRPGLDLSAAYGLAGDGDDLGEAAPDEWTAAVGLSLDLPVDRKPERNAYVASVIALERARRDYQRRRDEVERDVVNRLRRIEQFEKQIDIQRQRIGSEERDVAIIEIRYESGDAEARDLLDARQGLTDARNALVDFLASHFIERLLLLRDLGILFVDARGTWKLE